MVSAIERVRNKWGIFSFSYSLGLEFRNNEASVRKAGVDSTWEGKRSPQGESSWRDIFSAFLSHQQYPAHSPTESCWEFLVIV